MISLFKNNSGQPPELDEVIKQAVNWVKNNFKVPNINPDSFYNLRLIVVFSIVFYFFCGFYIVAPAQRAVVTRFGAYVATTNPGVHWRIFGIDNIKIINVERINQLNYHAEMLTKDENYVDIDVAVMYRINNPCKYIFAATNPDESTYHATASAARQAAGRTTLEKIITTGRSEVRLDIEQQLISILDLYEMGIEIVDVKLQDAKPPQEVQEAFDDAIKAREDEQRFINKAMAYRNEVIPKAKGVAYEIINSAEAYRNNIVAQAKSEVSLFQAASQAYLLNPQVQSIQLHTNAVENILSSSSKIITNSKNLNVLQLGQLNIEGKK